MGKAYAEAGPSPPVQRTLGSKGQAVVFTSPLIPLPITGPQELISKSDSQISINDHADIRATSNKIFQISPEELGNLDVVHGRRGGGVGFGGEKGDFSASLPGVDGSNDLR